MKKFDDFTFVLKRFDRGNCNC
jgi:hypothetical protein